MIDQERYLKATFYLDYDHPEVAAFTYRTVGDCLDPVQQAVKLYYAVRDTILYDPFHVDLSEKALKASAVLRRGSGFCVEKANLLAAGARLLGIPSRLGLADVKNHVGAERLVEILRTDVFACHGYTELYLGDKWVKATPAFNGSLCEKLNVSPLLFNGKDDSVFQEYDGPGERRFMEYLYDHGTFDDVPRVYMIEVLQKAYPHLLEPDNMVASKENFFNLE